MKKLIAIIIVLIIIPVTYAGYVLMERERTVSQHVALNINEDMSELYKCINRINGDFINQASMDREYVALEVIVKRLKSEIDTLLIMHPQLKLELKQIISNYVQLVDKRIYGIDRHRAMELMNEINKYICLYCESGIYSMEGSYETILLRDEYLKKQISEIGYDKYRNMNMDIISLK